MRITSLVIIIAVFMAIFSLCLVSEARPLMEDFASDNNGISNYPSVYQNAKYNMAFWLEQLVSGPSDGGAGH